MAKNNSVLNLLQVIFTLVGFGLITGGYMAPAGSKTQDGFPLHYFLYGLGGFFVLFSTILFSAIRYFGKREAEQKIYLKKNGIKGKARVLTMHQTNVYINHVPQVVLRLQVTTNLGEQFETPYKKAIPMQYYNILHPNFDLPIYIDPVNRNKMFIDFEQAWMELAKQPANTAANLG